MPAYFAPGVHCSGPARDLPRFARLRAGDRWKAANGSQEGQQGTVAWFGGDAPEPGTSGWEKCADGLFYLPGRPLPPQHDLARPHRVEGIDYITSQGVTLTIPLAVGAPRKLSFTGKQVGPPVVAFAQRAFALFDRLNSDEKIPSLDPEVLGLVADAIGYVYFTTPEMLDELGWITSADIDPIICCLMGANPKAAQPAGASLPSPAGA